MTRKEKELMIGDWLQHASGKCFQITRLDMWGDGSVHFACGYPHLWEYNNKFTPIPLTAEILEKNGYKCEEIIQRHWISEDGRILLRNDEMFINSNNKWFIHIDNEDMQSIGYFEITYVHELQHALRLCGIEKKIEL